MSLEWIVYVIAIVLGVCMAGSFRGLPKMFGVLFAAMGILGCVISAVEIFERRRK